ncbi:carnitine dehydratase [Brevibacterium linens]|uniref:Carnitine dehydratase n=1 Tax=Brevibacterium linens TaxID=1703 RepID=A0A144MDY6_BRELN|nr:CoA transferase [Brevibacterium linens]AMT92931.1 carnitine dehydratase [Brevibacterium linens]
MQHREPLDGVTVITLAVNLPGPLAAARLKSMGASVIKVEPPVGDPLEVATTAYYGELTAGQDIRKVDLKSEGGPKELDALAAEADILLTAMRPRAAAALGLPELIERHELVHVEIVGFAGDRADVPGHDLTYQAAHATLVPGTMPTVPVADVLGGEHAALEALAGLRQKEQLGAVGGIVKRVVLDEAAAWAAGPARHGLSSPGSHLGGGSPFYNTYPTADGHIAVACIEPHFAKALAEHIGTEEAVLEATFAEKPTAHWVDFAAEHDLPIEAVRTG